MTDPLDLARRAVSCKGFRFLPGMRFLTHGPSGERFAAWGRVDSVAIAEWPAGDYLPDLTDPLTALGLLALVREAWGDPDIAAVPFWFLGSLRWRVGAMYGGDFVEPDHRETGHATEAEALVAALEAAPTR